MPNIADEDPKDPNRLKLKLETSDGESFNLTSRVEPTMADEMLVQVALSLSDA